MLVSQRKVLSSWSPRGIAILVCLLTPTALLGMIECSGDDSSSSGSSSGSGSGSGSTSSGSSSGSPGNCTPYVSTGDTTTPVTFKTDVLPVLQSNCSNGNTSCHSGPMNSTPMESNGSSLAFASEDGGALGMVNGMPGPAYIVSTLVNVPSSTDHEMNLVTPGDAGASFLMHKMDGDQCLFALSTCNKQMFQDQPYDPGYNCGRSMPTSDAATVPLQPTNAPASDLLKPALRDKVRAWIQQGAQNN